VTAGEDSLAKQWDTSTWKLMQEFIGHESGMGSARFSPDGTQLLTASDDETVCLWDINSGTLLHAFADPIDSIWRAIFSPDGKWIASSSFDGEIILWDSESKEMITRIQGHSSQTAGLTFSKDGSQLVSASDDGNIKFWDVESLLCKDNANAELIVLTDLPDLQAIHVSFSSDGTKLLSGGMDTVTIRSANMSIQQPPFLIEDANRLIAETEILVAQDDITEKNIERVVANSQKCCRFFPSYKSFTFLGLSQYLEDQLPEAKASLEEAYRLQKLTYRHPDRPPAIEGLLAMVYLRTGEVVAAQKMRQLFEAKYQEENWSQDAPMKKLSNMLSQLNQQPDLEKAEP
jgi:WD40 repeat protein